MNFKIILLMIIAGLAVLFIIQNVAVTVGIFFWTISLLCPADPLVLAMGFALDGFCTAL